MSKWEANQVTVVTRELESLCKPDPLLRQLIMTQKISYNLLSKTCNNLGGRMPVAFTKDQLANTSNLFQVCTVNILKSRIYFCSCCFS